MPTLHNDWSQIILQGNPAYDPLVHLHIHFKVSLMNFKLKWALICLQVIKKAQVKCLQCSFLTVSSDQTLIKVAEIYSGLTALVHFSLNIKSSPSILQGSIEYFVIFRDYLLVMN